MDINIAEQSWNKNRREDKDQGAGPKSDLIPKIGQERPVVGSDARTTQSADGQRRRQHGNDTRYMKEALGGNEDAISERQSESGISEPGGANPWTALQ